jgi:hypothetical protein
MAERKLFTIRTEMYGKVRKSQSVPKWMAQWWSYSQSVPKCMAERKLFTIRTEMYGREETIHNPYRNVRHSKEVTIRTEMNGTVMKLLTIRTEMYNTCEEATHNPCRNEWHSGAATHNPYPNLRHSVEAIHNSYRNTKHFVHYKTRYMKHESELHTATSINLMLCYRSKVERSDRDTSENIYSALIPPPPSATESKQRVARLSEENNTGMHGE